mmetsp:Transcript_15846/g.35504  ORF Transcript_15846/g.35504 Transcript_15846/m.35504 type:complete len:499 (-) Transcript_15846:86-1582(-)
MTSYQAMVLAPASPPDQGPSQMSMSASGELRRTVYDVVPLEGSTRSTMDTPRRGGEAGDADAKYMESATRRVMTSTTMVSSSPARSTSSTSKARTEEVSRHCSDLEDVLLTLRSRRRVSKSSSSRITTSMGMRDLPMSNDSAFQVVETVLVDKPCSVTVPKFNLAERTMVKEMATVVPKIERRTEVREVPRLEVQVIEKVLEVPRTEYIDKVVEVPEVHVVEKIVEVPQVKVEERIKRVPRVEFREVVRTIPKVEVQVVERTVEVPQICHVEKIVEVPQVQVVEKVVEVPQVQVVEVVKTVPQIQVQEHVVVRPPQTVYTAPAPATVVTPVMQSVATPVVQAPTDLFSMLDRNHDGVITRNEFRQAVEDAVSVRPASTLRSMPLAPTMQAVEEPVRQVSSIRPMQYSQNMYSSPPVQLASTTACSTPPVHLAASLRGATPTTIMEPAATAVQVSAQPALGMSMATSPSSTAFPATPSTSRLTPQATNATAPGRCYAAY